MDVRSLDKDLGAGLRAGGRGAGDIDIGDIGLHCLEAHLGFAIFADEFDAEVFKEGLVLLVAREQEDEIGGDGLARVERGGVFVDGFYGRLWVEGDFVLFDKVFDFGIEPVFDAVWVEGFAAIGHGDLCAGAKESDGGFDGGVLAADDEDALVGVLMDITEVV